MLRWAWLLIVLVVAARADDCECSIRYRVPVLNTDYSAGTAIYVLNVALARTLDHAKGHAYVDIDVDGLLYAPTTETSAQGTPYTRAVLFSFSNPGNGRPVVASTYGAYSAHSVVWIDRDGAYNCPDMRQLNTTHYYFYSGARADIEAFYCPYRLNDGVTCCWKNAGASCPVPIAGELALSDARFVNQTRSHWLQQGHLVRYNPNANCHLLPSAWDPANSCQFPRVGCWDVPCAVGSHTDIPCSGNGYCVASNASDLTGGINALYVTPYHCECRTVAGAPYDGFTAYSRLDCSQTRDADVEPYGCGENMCGTTLGGRLPARCHNYQDPDETGLCTNWHAIGFTAPNDLEAKCDCNGLAFDGPWCTVSRCNDGDGCTIGHGECCNQALGGGVCTVGSGEEFACYCTDKWYGDACQYETDVGPNNGCCETGNPDCVNLPAPTSTNVPTRVCNGHGTPTNDGINCVCDCNEGRDGVHCENRLCDVNELNNTDATRADCNEATGVWTCRLPFNTTRNSTGFATHGLCNNPRCLGLGMNGLADTGSLEQCHCAAGYSVPARTTTPINGIPTNEFRCYADCTNDCGGDPLNRGYCFYNSLTLGSQCICLLHFTVDPDEGCAEFCQTPYAVQVGDSLYQSGFGDDEGCHSDGVGGVQCKCNCASGYTGDRCRTDLNECATPGLCQHGGTCTNNDGAYVCACMAGWTGANCQTAIVSSSSSSSTASAHSSSTAHSSSSSSSSSSTAAAAEEVPESSSSTAAAVVVAVKKSSTVTIVVGSVAGVAVLAIVVGVVSGVFATTTPLSAAAAAAAAAKSGAYYAAGQAVAMRGILNSRTSGAPWYNAPSRSRSRERRTRDDYDL